MNRLILCAALLAVGAAGTAIAQSTGGFSPSSSGSAAAGSSPVGTVLPYTVQSGSTAPTLPGHAITAENRPTGRSWTGSTSTGKMAGAPPQTGPAGPGQEPAKRSVVSRNDVQGFDGISFHDVHDDVLMDSHVLAWASAPKPAKP